MMAIFSEKGGVCDVTVTCDVIGRTFEDIFRAKIQHTLLIQNTCDGKDDDLKIKNNLFNPFFYRS